MFWPPPTQMHEHSRYIACQCCKEYLLHHIICLPLDKWTSLTPSFAALLASLTPSHLEIDHSEKCLNVKARNIYKHPPANACVHDCQNLQAQKALSEGKGSFLLQGTRWTDIKRGSRSQVCGRATAWCATRKRLFTERNPRFLPSDTKTLFSIWKVQLNCSLSDRLHVCLCFAPLGDAIAWW